MAQILFFFTNDFPFGKDETFIENELPILSEFFDKIVVVSNDCVNRQTRTVNSNVTIERSPYHLTLINKLIAFKGIFSKEFTSEIDCIKTVYKKPVTFTIIKTVLFTLRKAEIFNKRFQEYISKHSQNDDSIYAYSYWNDDTAYALTRLKKTIPSIKTFSRMHRWDVYFEQNESDYLPFRLPIFEQMNAVFSISENGKQYTEQLFNKLFPKIIVSRLGVPPHNQNPGNPEVFTILTISNIVPVKNLHLLIKALSKISFQFRWIHIGDGIQRPEIELLAEHFIPGKYLFLGQKTNAEVINFIEETPISILINVSTSEGIPVSIMESFSCGIPVIALNVGGNCEIVSDYNGRLLPSNADENVVASAIMELYSLPTQGMLSLKDNAYKCWKEKYSSINNYKNFIYVIKDFID